MDILLVIITVFMAITGLVFWIGLIRLIWRLGSKK